MSSQTQAENISAFLDGEMSEAESRRFLAEIAKDPEATAEMQRMLKLRELIADALAPQGAPAPRLPAELQQRWQTAIRAEAAAKAPANSSSAVSGPKTVRPQSFYWRTAAPIAATVLIAVGVLWLYGRMEDPTGGEMASAPPVPGHTAVAMLDAESAGRAAAEKGPAAEGSGLKHKSDDEQAPHAGEPQAVPAKASASEETALAGGAALADAGGVAPAASRAPDTTGATPSAPRTDPPRPAAPPAAAPAERPQRQPAPVADAAMAVLEDAPDAGVMQTGNGLAEGPKAVAPEVPTGTAATAMAGNPTVNSVPEQAVTQSSMAKPGEPAGVSKTNTDQYVDATLESLYIPYNDQNVMLVRSWVEKHGGKAQFKAAPTRGESLSGPPFLGFVTERRTETGAEPTLQVSLPAAELAALKSYVSGIRPLERPTDVAQTPAAVAASAVDLRIEPSQSDTITDK